MGKIAKALMGDQEDSKISRHALDTGNTLISRVESINLSFKEQGIEERAKLMKLGYVNLRIVPINTDALRMITKEEAETAAAVLYFVMGMQVKLGSPHPESPAFGELKKKLEVKGLKVDVALISDESLKHAFSLYQTNKIITHTEFLPKFEAEHIQAFEKELQELKELKDKIDLMPVNDAINAILFGAAKVGTSDIHIQPEESQVLIRFRVDGMLHLIFTMSHSVFQRMGMQLKFKAQMKMNIANKPQDGKFLFRMENKDIDIRISFLPTEFGESIVMRLLDAEKGIRTFDQLGFLGINYQYLEYAIKKPYGIILVSGPTGSGKTTTLYSIMNYLNTSGIKIITLEDPIEYHLANIAQSQIRETEGYTFADGLRSILRQNPDIIMVGEMRDGETADIAVQAALTGHLVLSTVHTNSAVETLPRLLNMGLKPYLLAPAIDAIVAQRLVRRLCPKCKKTAPVTPQETAVFQDAVHTIMQYHPEFRLDLPKETYKGVGCEICSGTGYKGQIAVLEVLVISDDMRNIILGGMAQKDIYAQARKDGMVTMREDGILKVMQGMTTIEEVIRVAS